MQLHHPAYPLMQTTAAHFPTMPHQQQQRGKAGTRQMSRQGSMAWNRLSSFLLLSGKGPELAPASLCSLTSLALLERLPLRCCPGSKTTVSGHPLARSEAHQPTHEYAHMMAQGDSVNTV